MEAVKKPKMQSWTLWFNTAMSIAAGVCSVVVDVIPPQAGIAGVIVMGICNVILRFKTKQPLV